MQLVGELPRQLFQHKLVTCDVLVHTGHVCETLVCDGRSVVGGEVLCLGVVGLGDRCEYRMLGQFDRGLQGALAQQLVT